MFLRARAKYTPCTRVQDALKHTRLSVHPASLHRVQCSSSKKQLVLPALSGQWMQRRRKTCRLLPPTAVEVRGLVLLVGNSLRLPHSAKQTFSIALPESFEMFCFGTCCLQEIFAHDVNLLCEFTASVYIFFLYSKLYSFKLISFHSWHTSTPWLFSMASGSSGFS